MGRRTLALLQGTLDMLVLKALAFGPGHGYAVAAWIREVSDDALLIEDGALYTALHRMEKRGWLRSEWGLSDNNRRARYYSLTTAGRRHMEGDERTWSAYADAVFKVLRAGSGS